MDRIVERLVRQLTNAARAGDWLTHTILYARLEAMAGQPGFIRALDRALAVVDWKVQS